MKQYFDKQSDTWQDIEQKYSRKASKLISIKITDVLFTLKIFIGLISLLRFIKRLELKQIFIGVWTFIWVACPTSFLIND